jgi:hypothetical protein
VTREIVIYALVLGLVLAGLLYAARWAIERAFVSARVTPAKPSVAEQQGKAELQRIDDHAQQQKQEVANAKGPDLLDLFRRRMFRRK